MDVFGARMPIEDMERLGLGFGRAKDYWGSRPELLISREYSIVVASFEDYRSHFTSTHRCIYTEMTMRVERSLQPGPSSLLAGEAATLLEEGGAYPFDDGRILEFLPFSQFEPGHRYVHFLSYDRDLGICWALKSWELRGGVAVPLDAEDRNRARSRKSVYAGMREEDFIAAIEKRLAEQSPGNGRE